MVKYSIVICKPYRSITIDTGLETMSIKLVLFCKCNRNRFIEIMCVTVSGDDCARRISVSINIIKALKTCIQLNGRQPNIEQHHWDFFLSLHELNSESSNQYAICESRTAEPLNNIDFKIQSTIDGLTVIVGFLCNRQFFLSLFFRSLFEKMVVVWSLSFSSWTVWHIM